MQEYPHAQTCGTGLEEPPEQSADTTTSGSQAKHVAGEAGQKARHAAQQVQEQARRAGEKVKEEAGWAVDAARHQGRKYLEQQQRRVSDALADLSAAVREAARELEERQDPTLASCTEALAEQLESASHFLDRGLDEVDTDLDDMARRRPELFLGGMFVAGLTLSRFLKASRRRRSESDAAERSAAEADEPAEIPAATTPSGVPETGPHASGEAVREPSHAHA